MAPIPTPAVQAAKGSQAVHLKGQNLKWSRTDLHGICSYLRVNSEMVKG